MSKIMLINVTHAEESRVGIVEDGQLESFEIESLSREHLKGNIYKGIVRRIHPAIEAAFVDIGADRDAFLPLDEICFRNLPSGRNGGFGSGSGDKGRRRIKDVLKSGDQVLVQIIKEQFTNKPPTLSTFYSLPGRYLVLLPGSEDAGISRKIEGEERARVRELLDRLKPPDGCGIIVRTAAGFDEESGELQRDLTYLQRLWENIRRHAETKRAPALVYREHDLVLRNIRDYFTPDINEIFIDNEDVYERARDFLQSVMPGKDRLLHFYQGEQPIFSRFGVEAQIESIYKRRVPLKSGGSIVIDGTEALTAIDVNSGGSMRGASQEETAHKTNLEAAREVARQLRLRDLGGIIVVDFIDMRQANHIADVERALRDAMRPEKARHDIGRISRLGLLEISRQRLRPAATASSYTACPMCEGHGSIRTTESAALVVLRKIHHRVSEGDVAQMKVGLPREVAMYLLNQKRDDLAVLEARYATRIQIVVSDKLMPHQSEIETKGREREAAGTPAVRPSDMARAANQVNGAARRRPAPPAVAGDEPLGPLSTRRPSATGRTEDEGEAADGRRRRRRRGGRGRREGGQREGAALEGATSAEDAVAGAESFAVAATSPEAPEVSESDMLGAHARVAHRPAAPADVDEDAAPTAIDEDRAPAAPAAPAERPPWELYLPASVPSVVAPSAASAAVAREVVADEPEPRRVEVRAVEPSADPFAHPGEPVVAPTDDPLAGGYAGAASAAEGDAEAAPARRRRRGRRGGRGRRRAATGAAAGTSGVEAVGVGDDFAPAGGPDLDLRDDASDEPVPVSAEPPGES